MRVPEFVRSSGMAVRVRRSVPLAVLLRRRGSSRRREVTAPNAGEGSTGHGKLALPVLLPFEDLAVGTRPTFRWQPVAGAERYRLSLKNLNNGRTLFFYDIADTSFRPPRGLPPGEYHWFVKALSPEAESTSKPGFVELVREQSLNERLAEIAFDRSKRRTEHEDSIAFARSLTHDSNKELKRQEIAERRTQLRSFPLNILLNVGHVCNIDCIMCPSGRMKDSRRIPEPLMEDLENYLPFLDNLLISGGEPLMYKNEVRRILSAADRFPKLRIGLHSNGQLIDDSWVQQLCSGKFSSLSISVDAARAETFATIRRRASFTKILEALQGIAARKPDTLSVTLNFVVFRRNFREIPEFVDLAHQYNVDEVNFQILRHTLFPELRDENILYDKALSADLLGVIGEAHEKCREYGINMVDKVKPFLFNTHPELLEHGDDYRFLPTYCTTVGIESDLDERIKGLLLQRKPEQRSKRKKLAVEASQIAKPAFFCSVPFENLNIDVQDSLVCCSAMRSYYYIPYGRTWQFLNDIWNSPQLQAARRLLLEGQGPNELCHPVCAFYHSGGYKRERDRYLWV